MTHKRFMQRTLVASAVAAALGCVSVPVFADELSELKAEIAAQRAQMDAQRLRLEAMEKKLFVIHETQNVNQLQMENLSTDTDVVTAKDTGIPEVATLARKRYVSRSPHPDDDLPPTGRGGGDDPVSLWRAGR